MKSEKLNYIISNLDLAAEFILNNSVYNMILFKADLGVGKTTLIKEICKKIGTIDNVVSPTFPILNVYKSKNDLIYHMDLYRVCLLYTSPSPRDLSTSRMPSSA